MIERGAEVEILPQAILEGSAITVYCPLAIGLLTGKYHAGMPMDATAPRGAADSRVITWLSQHGGEIERFLQFAGAMGVQPAHLAIAWIAHSPAVTAPIVGVSSVSQLESSSKAFDIALSDADYQAIAAIFSTEVQEDGLQLFPGLKYNFPRLRRTLKVAGK